MRISGSSLVPFDPEIERTSCSLRKAGRQISLVEEDSPIVSSDYEKEDSMKAPTPFTMRDYCKQIDEWHVSRGFVPADPANFDIKNFVLSGLRDNLFNENTIIDPWAHLARFYETVSMSKLDGVSEDQVNLRLFGFSLIGRAKDWLLCLPNGTI